MLKLAVFDEEHSKRYVEYFMLNFFRFLHSKMIDKIVAYKIGYYSYCTKQMIQPKNSKNCPHFYLLRTLRLFCVRCEKLFLAKPATNRNVRYEFFPLLKERLIILTIALWKSKVKRTPFSFFTFNPYFAAVFFYKFFTKEKS